MTTTTTMTAISAMTSITTLTPEQIAYFHTNGFLALEPITDEEELAWMREVYDRIFAERAGRDEGNQFDLGGADEEGREATLPQILNPAKYAPELNNGKFLINATAIAKQLLGDEATGGVAHAIFKPAGNGAPTPWHQDEAYWDPKWEYRSISIWMPLQEATIENGCLWFVPGSHEWEIYPHQSIGGDSRVHGLEVLGADTSTAIACPLKPGGITVHLNRTLHYAGPNISDIPRRALILGYGLASKPYPIERRFPWNEIKHTAREERRKATVEG
jgi:ectoine hydroxylase-related dioxygenase (phytanoyl-CoA dioxygenase family)